MQTTWDYVTTVTEEELMREPHKLKLTKVVIQHTELRTYQVLVKRVRDPQWAALATRRAQHYPRQFMNLPPLLKRLAKRFPYLKEVTIEDLNPPVMTVALQRAGKKP